jgi:hypothetical protein
MDHWMWLVPLVGILSTAVVCGTDMFFTISLSSSKPSFPESSPRPPGSVLRFLPFALAIVVSGVLLANAQHACELTCALLIPVDAQARRIFFKLGLEDANNELPQRENRKQERQ